MSFLLEDGEEPKIMQEHQKITANHRNRQLKLMVLVLFCAGKMGSEYLEILPQKCILNVQDQYPKAENASCYFSILNSPQGVLLVRDCISCGFDPC